MATSIAVQPIRILLVNLSGVLGQIIANLVQSQPDMLVVGEINGHVEVLVAVLEGVDVVILGASQKFPLPSICSHLLREFPDLKIMIYTASENEAHGYWLDIRRCRVKVASGTSLIEGLRTLHLVEPHF